MTDYRREEAKHVRDAASQKAYDRAHREHQNNGDEQRYAAANYAMSFTKGLDHNYETGLVNDAVDFEAFRTAVDNGFAEPFTSRIDVPRIPRDEEEEKPRRKWEAPTAGVVYELQGPDPQSVTMPPAPPLCSDELTFEMAEVYELALLRDVPFNQLEKDGGSTELGDAICRLNNLQYAKDRFKGRPRKTDKAGKLDEQTVFRGSSPGVEKGPYLSQFMIIGNQSPDETRKPSDGYINFGAQSIDQRVVEAEPKVDYMMKWHDWHNVQQGFDVGALGKGQVTGKRRFIYTLRDLATYVHVDALYQAYLNACLILLGNKTPFDPGFDLLSGGGKFYDRSKEKKIDLSAGGFALWGGPHILSLVTEVATRGLKAVRYQKFNNHIRARPEVLAARIEKADDIEKRYPSLCGCFSDMEAALKEACCEGESGPKDVLTLIRDNNENASENGGERTALLPMAFIEGSPMHPAYGAGHATVAGACVTILKAFFDTSAIFVKIGDVAGFHTKDQILQALKKAKEDKKKLSVEAGAYRVVEVEKPKKGDETYQLDFDPCGSFQLVGEGDKAYLTYKSKKPCCPLTLEDELNKLAANISIGRNIGGVHYFTDYYDSLRMGEEIAIGILEEQALCYKTDPFVLSVPTFDGKVRRIGAR